MSTRHEKNGLLKEAIRLALYASLATAAVSPAAMAQQNDDEVEEVVTTGSRITRTTIEESGNLVSMDREDIDATGNLMIADVLRSSPLNTYGSFSERSGSSAQSNATIDLRGLGDSRTLVLINGHRIPGSPNLGAASVNINMIPMAAVERIEMLPDAASAVYGSDAIAGVVNIIMKKGYDGLTFSARKGERSNDDGGDSNLSLLGGISGDRGNITFAIERNHRDPIFDKDRDYTKPRLNDLDGDGVVDMYFETEGISYYSKNIELWDENTGYYDFAPATNCPTGNGFVGLIGGAAFGVPEVCGYAYAEISANKAELTRTNTYLDASFDISDNTEFYVQALFSRVESFGRYAPPAAVWENMPPDYSDVPFDINALLASGDITPDYELTGYYRWTQVGNRDNFVTDTQYDLTSGFKGDINDDVSYEVYAQYSRYDSKEYGKYYLSYPGREWVLNGNTNDPSDPNLCSTDDIWDPCNAKFLKATVGQDNFTTLKKLYAHLQWSAGDYFDAGETLIVAGMETFDTEFQNQYDAASEVGLIGGSAGNSSAGDRNVDAIFVESLIPLPNEVELDIALRSDDYSDFGSKVSPSLGITWKTNEDVTLRAKWSKGFRAPSLASLYGPSTFSAEYAKDWTSCIAAGATRCPTRQYDTYITTNADLDAEESTNYSLGVTWDMSEEWTIDLAYWNIDIENLISTRSTQSMFYAEAAGIALDPSTGNYIDRSGGIPVVHVTSDNEGELRASGMDIQLNGNIETEYGIFSPFLLASQSFSYEQQAYYRGPIQDTAGFSGQPELRMNLGLNWSTGPHSVDFQVNYIGDHANDEKVDIGGSNLLVPSSEKVDTWTTIDASYSYDAGNYGKFKIGSTNITNEDPVLSVGDELFENPELYDNTGRVIYTEYTIEF